MNSERGRDDECTCVLSTGIHTRRTMSVSWAEAESGRVGDECGRCGWQRECGGGFLGSRGGRLPGVGANLLGLVTAQEPALGQARPSDLKIGKNSPASIRWILQYVDGRLAWGCRVAHSESLLSDARSDADPDPDHDSISNMCSRKTTSDHCLRQRSPSQLKTPSPRVRGPCNKKLNTSCSKQHHTILCPYQTTMF